MVALPKRATATQRCEDFRSILLSDVLGKAYHRHLRQQLVGALTSQATAMQFGPTPHSSLEMPALYVRAFLQGAQVAKVSSTVLFVDIKEAFYRLVRQLVAPVQDTADAIFTVLDRLALPEPHRSVLQAMMGGADLVTVGHRSPLLAACVADVLQHTWFAVRGSGQLTATKSGSRPGDPLADILFGFVLSAFLQQTEQALEEAGLITELPPCAGPLLLDGPSQRINCTAWADDIALPQLWSEPSGLEKELPTLHRPS